MTPTQDKYSYNDEEEKDYSSIRGKSNKNYSQYDESDNLSMKKSISENKDDNDLSASKRKDSGLKTSPQVKNLQD